jgi:hypothetical protein
VRFVRVGLMNRVALAALASALLAALSPPAGGAANRADQSALESAAVAMYLPASYSDLKTALPLENFYDLAAARLITTCLSQHGFNVTYPYAARTYNWSDANSLFPDLKRVARDGLLTPSDLAGERDWVPPVPPGQRDQFYAVLGNCARLVTGAERDGSRLWLALQEQWVDVDAAGDFRPVYLRLVEKFAACVERRGYEGSTPASFLFGVDYLIQQSLAAGEPLPSQEAISLRAGKVYAICYRAANAYRQAIRRRARVRFIDQHVREIHAAERQLEATLTQLAEEAGHSLPTLWPRFVVGSQRLATPSPQTRMPADAARAP